MYGYEWTGQNGIYRLSVNSKIEKEIRPVFKEELASTSIGHIRTRMHRCCGPRGFVATF